HLFPVRRYARPPALPLFPYPTLFRSAADDREPGTAAGAAVADRVEDRDGRVRALLQHRALAAVQCHDRAQPRDAAEAQVAATRRDRKSTRLNSSHVKISYAVLCSEQK